MDDPILITLISALGIKEVKDIQCPEFEHAGFAADKFGRPRQYQEVLGGIAYNVIESGLKS